MWASTHLGIIPMETLLVYSHDDDVLSHALAVNYVQRNARDYHVSLGMCKIPSHTALSRSAPAEAHPRERNGSITTSAGVAHSRGALPAMGTGANVKCRQRCTHLALVLARTTNSS